MRPTARTTGPIHASGPITKAIANPPPTVTANVIQQILWISCHADPPKAGGQNRRRGHDEQDVQADNAVEQHRGQRFRSVVRVLVIEHHHLYQIAADDAQRGQIE